MKKRLFFCLPLLPVLFCFSLFSLTANSTFAQLTEPKIKVSVRILETGYHNIDDKGKNKLVWKFYKGSSLNQASVLTNAKSESCFLLKSKKNNKTKEISDEKNALSSFIADISGFSITMEAFLNKKGGEKCIADTKDEFYSIKTENIKPGNLADGAWSEEIKIEDAFPHFFAIIIYKYELIEGLSLIEPSGNNLVNDASKNIELSLPIKLPKKETLPFTWSYSIENEDNWTTIPNSAEDKSKIVFNPLKNIFRNIQLTSSKKVDFKAEIKMGGKTETSDPFTLTFVPPPPFFDKEKDMQLIPVCNGLTNGSIEIKNIKTTAAEIKYVLRKKTETEQCDLKAPSLETCPDFVGTGTVSASKTLRIKSLAAGEYLLYIFNANLESGEVNTVTQFTITELTPFKIIDTESNSTNPTCTHEKGGEIYMTIEGAANLWQIAIIPNKGNFAKEGNRISFKNLEAGKYTVYLSDQCGPEKSKTFNLKKPKQISINTKDITSLLDNGDFYIQLNVLNGSNDYKLKVTDPENDVTENTLSFLPDIKVPVSKVGIYNIEVTDVSTPNCYPARVKIKIEKSSKKEKFKFNVLE